MSSKLACFVFVYSLNSDKLGCGSIISHFSGYNGLMMTSTLSEEGLGPGEVIKQWMSDFSKVIPGLKNPSPLKNNIGMGSDACRPFLIMTK